MVLSRTIFGSSRARGPAGVSMIDFVQSSVAGVLGALGNSAADELPPQVDVGSSFVPVSGSV